MIDEEFVLSRDEALAEALLFAAGDLVKISDIAFVLRLSTKEATAVMEKLMTIYENRNGGILIRKIGEGYQFYSKPDFYEDMRDFFAKPRNPALSRAAMETLSIIAYNQPITRSGIELVRGVNSDSVILRLIEKGYIYESGRSEGPGRPMLYSTTENFLRAMGISNLGELPSLDEIETEETLDEQSILEYNEDTQEST